MKKKDADPFGLINAEEFDFFRGQEPTLGFLLKQPLVGWSLPEKVFGVGFVFFGCWKGERASIAWKNMYGLEFVEYNFIPGRVWTWKPSFF